MNTSTNLRPWLGLVALSAVSLLGTSFSRANVNTVERERMLQAATEEVDALPSTIGPWRSEAAAPLSDELHKALHCRAYQSRMYVNGETGERVSLVLVAGNAAPLVTLAPQAFYENDQLDLAEPGQPETIGEQAEFLPFTLASRSETGKTLRTYLAWRTSDGRWEAPRNPKLALGGQPMLFRLQVATASDSNACRRLLTDFLAVTNHPFHSH